MFSQMESNRILRQLGQKAFTLCTFVSAILLAISLAYTIYLHRLFGGAHSETGVVFDAGSSGTKVYIYEWKGDWSDGEKTIKTITEIGYTKSKGTALADIRGNIVDGVAEHFDPLFQYIDDIIPKKMRSRTLLSLGATAGMRALFETDSELYNEIMKKVKQYLHKPGDYRTNMEHIRVLNGEEEGIFAWYTTNLLQAKIEPKARKLMTYGMLDMGGGSMQVAFSPMEVNMDEVPIIHEFHKLTIYHSSIPVYVKSFDCMGGDYSYMRYLSILASNTLNSIIDDPCGLKGQNVTIKRTELLTHPCAISPINNPNDDLIFVGTGNSSQCANVVQSMFPVQTSRHSSMLLNNQTMILIDSGSRFKAMGLFFYAWENLNSPVGAHEFHQTLQSQCEEEISGKVDKYRQKICYDGHYIRTVLQTMGMSMSSFGTDKVEPIDNLLGNKTRGWALGYLLAVHDALPKVYPLYSSKIRHLSTHLIYLLSFLCITAALTVLAYLTKPKNER